MMSYIYCKAAGSSQREVGHTEMKLHLKHKEKIEKNRKKNKNRGET